MTTTPVRLRFAPSPTGPIHVGNAHTMLFNWLWCRNLGGTFILRFEDTDRERSRPEWETVILNEMRWLGLDWDEGPDIDGPYAPYRQTARMDLYQHYFAMLKQRQAVYPCYCTAEELEAERKEADKRKVAYRYSRKCLFLSEEERAEKEAAGLHPVWRLRVPDDEILAYEDMIRGRIEFPAQSIGDPILVRSNGMPLYNFAVVIDDITMKITHGVRGEGHIANTPIQVLIYRALGIEPPVFAHCSHITNPERGKISKRKGEMSVSSYRERGVVGEAMLNFLALLGWAPEGEGRDILTKEEIIREFNIQDVNRASAIFDEEKLKWVNGMYLRRKSIEEFAELSLPFVVQAGLATERALRERWPWFCEMMALVQERVRLLEEVPSYIDFFFQKNLTYESEAVKKYLTAKNRTFLRQIAEIVPDLAWNVEVVESRIRAILQQMELPLRDALLALRVAISGKKVSPPLFESMVLLGAEQTRQRLLHCVYDEVKEG